MIMFRLLGLVIIVWLLIGTAAAWQRDYFKSHKETCAHTATIIATIAAGPLNYAGANPKVHCSVPQPSK
jgi:hypothetical protein